MALLDFSRRVGYTFGHGNHNIHGGEVHEAQWIRNRVRPAAPRGVKAGRIPGSDRRLRRNRHQREQFTEWAPYSVEVQVPDNLKDYPDLAGRIRKEE